MLEVKNLTFRYESYESTSSRVLLNNVSFTLRKNENILILGRPGAGKTTLSFILSGLTPKYNDGELTGTVLYDGKGVDEALEELTVFSLVPQNTADSMITSTVEEELAFPLESMPTVLQYFSGIVPARWFVEAARKLMIQGVAPSFVVRETLILALMAAVLLVLSLVKFKRRLE